MSGRPIVDSQHLVVTHFLCWLCCTAFGLFALAAVSGCRSSPTAIVVQDDSAERLQQIGAAYSRASIKLGRPPRDVSEITEFLPTTPDGTGPEQVLRSPNDNEPYVIVWGVDFQQLAMSTGNVDVILAYEKLGKNGKRHVLKPPSIALLMADAEFQTARFPPGHLPAP